MALKKTGESPVFFNVWSWITLGYLNNFLNLDIYAFDITVVPCAWILNVTFENAEVFLVFVGILAYF
jgi:hypothetical protein